MAINPQSVLSQLRMMSDQQLQQYAAMHKNDPFVFPLAFQESQTRKQMRSEAQAMQPAQPKVADQALASMASEPMPEDVGIGALPAENMEGMCGGGIVAFDEGGEVPRFQAGGTPPSAGTQFGIPGMVTGSPILPQAGYKSPDEMTLWEKIQAYRHARQAEREAYQRKQGAPASAAYTPTGVDPFAYDQASFPMPTAGAAGASSTGQNNAAPAGQGGNTAAPPPTAPTIAPTSFKPAEAPTIANAKELAGQLLDTGAYKSEIEKYQKAEQDAVDALRKAREEGKPQGKAYEEYEATLREETKDLGRQKGEAQGEAWLTAGLAVLGGSSPYALQNLGLATKGVEQYRDAMKDIRKATRENAKGLADIAQARRAEERGDWEKTQEFEERANTRMSNARKFGIEGLMSLGVKSAELAGRAYDTQVQQAGMDRRTLAELQSREKIAGAQLSAPSGVEKLVQRIQTDPKFAEAYEKYASIGPGVRGEYAALQKYMGPQGEMSLRMMESGTPEQKAMAKAIRQKLQTMMLSPVDVPNALP